LAFTLFLAVMTWGVSTALEEEPPTVAERQEGPDKKRALAEAQAQKARFNSTKTLEQLTHAQLEMAEAHAERGEWVRVKSILKGTRPQGPRQEALKDTLVAVADYQAGTRNALSLVNRLTLLQKNKRLDLLPPAARKQVASVFGSIRDRLWGETDSAKGLRLAEKLYELEPRNYQTLLCRADAQFRHGQIKDYRQTLKQVEEQVPPEDDRARDRLDVLRALVLARYSTRPAERNQAARLITRLVPAVPSERSRTDLCLAFAELAEKGKGPNLAGCQEVIDKVARKLPQPAQRYASYGRGVLLAARAPKAAAQEMLVAFSGATVAPELQTEQRKERAVAVFQRAASQLREKTALGNPFGKSEYADAAYRYLAKAQFLSGEKLAHDQRLNYALAAWYKPSSDDRPALALAKEMSRGRSKTVVGKSRGGHKTVVRTDFPFSGRSKPGDYLLSLAVAKIQTKHNAPGAIQSYLNTLNLINQRKREGEAEPGTTPPIDVKKGEEEFAALDLYKEVFQPALGLGQRLLSRDAPPDRALKKNLAQLNASLARLIQSQPNVKWPFHKRQKVFALYNAAVRLDPSRPEYYVGRGYARSSLPSPDLAQVQKDADTAIKLGKGQLAGGHGLRGYVALLRARRETDESARMSQLTKAIEDCQRAIDLHKKRKKGPAGELALLLTNRSLAYSALAKLDRSRSKSFLSVAVKDARAAKQLQPNPSAQTLATLGVALEDIALGSADQSYDSAIMAYTEAIAVADDSPSHFLLDRGRCQFRKAAVGKADKAVLQKAITDLNVVVGADRKSPEAAEAYYWLGQVYWIHPDHGARDKFARADECFGTAVKLARDQKLPEWGTYAKEWSRLALAEARKAPRGAQAATLIKKARQRAQSILKGHKDAEAALLLGAAYQLEGKPNEALKAYGQVLPRDLARADQSHLPLLLARVELQLDETMRDKLKEKPRFGAVAWEAEQAVRLARHSSIDGVTKARAHGLAGLAEHAAAFKEVELHRPTIIKGPDYQEDALNNLRKALDLDPKHEASWKWRLALAEGLNFARRQAKTDKEKAAYRKEALTRLREIDLGKVPSQVRPDINNLIKSLGGDRKPK
jgi:tetratricopeptide (TPR) repeat protein